MPRRVAHAIDQAIKVGVPRARPEHGQLGVHLRQRRTNRPQTARSHADELTSQYDAEHREQAGRGPDGKTAPAGVQQAVDAERAEHRGRGGKLDEVVVVGADLCQADQLQARREPIDDQQPCVAAPPWPEEKEGARQRERQPLRGDELANQAVGHGRVEGEERRCEVFHERARRELQPDTRTADDQRRRRARERADTPSVRPQPDTAGQQRGHERLLGQQRQPRQDARGD